MTEDEKKELEFRCARIVRSRLARLRWTHGFIDPEVNEAKAEAIEDDTCEVVVTFKGEGSYPRVFRVKAYSHDYRIWEL